MQEVTPEKDKEDVVETSDIEVRAEAEEDVNVIDENIVDAEDVDEDDEDMDELEEALARIEELEEENNNLNTRALRAQADMENFKKRHERDKLESIKFASKGVFLQILDVLDNFDRALSAVSDPKDNFVIGVNMIHKQLLDVMAQNGVEEIQAEGRLFDPYLDEALAQEPTSEHEESTIIEVFQKGYRFKGNLLRPTKVKVACPPVAEESAEPEEEENGEA